MKEKKEYIISVEEDGKVICSERILSDDEKVGARNYKWWKAYYTDGGGKRWAKSIVITMMCGSDIIRQVSLTK